MNKGISLCALHVIFDNLMFPFSKVKIVTYFGFASLLIFIAMWIFYLIKAWNTDRKSAKVMKTAHVSRKIRGGTIKRNITIV